MEGLGGLFWIFIILSMVQPMIARRLLEAKRLALFQALEKRSNSRVIALIHRQETMGFLGFPLVKYIDIQDSEQVLRAIRLTADDVPIDLILHTPGGLVLASEQIAEALRAHPAKVTVHIPHYAMSGGTLIALAADAIVMDRSAVMGQVDPQLGDKPAAALVRLVDAKPLEHVDDETWILADMGRRALAQVEATVRRLLTGKVDDPTLERIVESLAKGQYTHDHPLRFDEVEALGLPVADGVPTEVFELMDLYPQPKNAQPSVQFIPTPYRRDGTPGPKSPPASPRS